jgi:hypothetical protein
MNGRESVVADRMVLCLTVVTGSLLQWLHVVRSVHTPRAGKGTNRTLHVQSRLAGAKAVATVAAPRIVLRVHEDQMSTLSQAA